MRLIDADALEYELGASERDIYVRGCLEDAPSVCPLEWILVSERLPEENVEVLVYLFERQAPYIAWVSDSRWRTEDFVVEPDDEPVAWMPLPKAYERTE